MQQCFFFSNTIIKKWFIALWVTVCLHICHLTTDEHQHWLINIWKASYMKTCYSTVSNAPFSYPQTAKVKCHNTSHSINSNNTTFKKSHHEKMCFKNSDQTKDRTVEWTCALLLRNKASSLSELLTADSWFLPPGFQPHWGTLATSLLHIDHSRGLTTTSDLDLDLLHSCIIKKKERKWGL